MNFIQNELDIRALPDLYTHTDGRRVTRETWEERRTELRKILANEEYGIAPTGRDDNQLDDPSVVTCTVEKTDERMCANKVRGEWLRISFPTPTGEFSFPVCIFIPKNKKDGERVPLVLHINFRPLVPDKYFPLEEITDCGFAAAQIYYEDVTTDNNDFTNGLAACWPEMGTTPETRIPTAWGKLRMWAFAASRALDVFLRRDDIAPDRIFVAGHSRLGKTALLTAALDDRFAGACSNDSGCAGAAITRSKTGETVEIISRVLSQWFCPNYRQYADHEYDMPFDQHFLSALIAPRAVCIGSAEEDKWADPLCEFLCAYLTAGVNHFLRTGEVPDADTRLSDSGLPFTDYPAPGCTVRMADGSVQYHLRPGTHYFSREDWGRYLSFFGEKFFS